MADTREKMECPTCGYKSYPQWLNDEAHCLKCQAVLKRRGGVHGTDKYDQRFCPGSVADKDLRAPGEASTYKESPGSAMESLGGACSKSPDGMCHYKFGKCTYCGKAEGKLHTPGGAPGECSKGGKCTFKFAKCSKCGRAEGQLAPRATSPRPASPNPAAAKAAGGGGGLKPPAAAAGKAASPRGASPSAGSQLKAPASPSAGTKASPRGASPAPGSPAAGKGGDDRTKVECPSCGYKCVPQWLNDEAHCLKCQAVLKRRAGVHGYDADTKDMRVCPGNVADKDRRAPGEASTYKESAGSAMESASGACTKSPDGMCHWKFGKCNYCGKAEGKLGAGGGAVSNPGGKGGSCPKGGKCVFKFAKCSKCGAKEF